MDALAMGRGTYDHIADLDPLPFGSRPVFVFTHRPPAPRNGVTFWQESPRAHPIGVSTALRLESAQSWPSGFVNLTYSRALQRGEVVGGSSPSCER